MCHARDGVSRRHVRLPVGGDHHPGREKIREPRHQERAVRNAVGTAVFYLDSRRTVVEPVHEHVVVEMSSFDDILRRDIVVARDAPSAPNRERRAGSRDKRFFKSRNMFAEYLDRFDLTVAKLAFGCDDRVRIRGAHRHLEIHFHEHEVVVV